MQTQELLNRYILALSLFRKKRGTLLASGASFFFILSATPFLLLTIRLLGFFISDDEQMRTQIMDMSNSILPTLAPDILNKAKSLIQGPLFAGAKFTIINSVVLLISALSFFNSIWSALFIISEDKSHLSLNKHFKGIVIIGITIGMLLITFSFHPFMLFLIDLAKNNFLVNALYLGFEFLRPLIDFLRSLNWESGLLFSSSIFYFFVFLGYFTILYRWFFSQKIPYKEALLASGTFAGLLLLVKNLFWIYFLYIRDGLISSYGDYYTIIVILIWIYLVMALFFFGACLCVILKEKPLFSRKVELPTT
jgi:membrane protein